MSSQPSLCGAHFPHPEPAGEKRTVIPVFLPFSGCPQRCVFCAQDMQSGRPEGNVILTLDRAEEELAAFARRHGAGVDAELGFFGGTFTLLPERDQERCLAFYARWKSRGVVAGLRCSTRPDAVSPGLLARLKQAGMTTVELGVQSFSSAALRVAGRGYDEAAALAACAMVKDAGLTLGLQLMPGMPGVDLATARRDMTLAAREAPRWLRLYPCLILAGTGLEILWRRGRYRPWSLGETTEFLARACLTAWGAGIRIIRLGLAPEADLERGVLGGPWHAALGGMVRGRALALYLAGKIREAGLEGARLRLGVPRRFQGEFWGHGGELKGEYAAMGIGREDVSWHDGETFFLEEALGGSKGERAGRWGVIRVVP